MQRTLFSPALSLWRILLFAGLTLPLMLVQLAAIKLGLELRKTLPLWYHKRVCRLIGIRIRRRGRISRTHPTLFVSNHVSYFDINVLGALIKGSFVAKADVADWPFFGWLAKLQRSVFVDRRRGQAANHRDSLAGRLEQGDDLILFPEGTSSDGNAVLPFKSALFAVAGLRPRGQALTVQPVSITYTHLDGMPMGRALRPFYAWYGDMELGSHLWQALGLGRVGVTVEFHPPVTLEEFGSRKALAEHCFRKVSEGVASALAGRPQRYPDAAAVGGEAAPGEA
jgi:1-acyl-sn-glycerol-3-phosphate acyltransferase